MEEAAPEVSPEPGGDRQSLGTESQGQATVDGRVWRRMSDLQGGD